MTIAIDIGGTKITAALLEGITILERRKIPSLVHTDPQRIVTTLRELCADWVPNASAIGIACTGLVSKRHVHFLSAGAKVKIPLKQNMEKAFAMPVTILNDAWAAAWGEYKKGQHGPEDTLVYITISTGIGGGIVQNGSLITSELGFAAHIGHTTVPMRPEHTRTCQCGRINCVEAVASGTAISKIASELLGRPITAKNAIETANTEIKIDRFLGDCAKGVADLIANLKAITDTPRVIIGGSVGLSSLFHQRIMKAVDSLPSLYHVEICRPAFGADSDLIGAGLAANEAKTILNNCD